MYVCVCVHMYTCICVCMHVCVRAHVCVHVYVYVCKPQSNVWSLSRMYVCMYVCIRYMCMCNSSQNMQAYAYKNTHMYALSKSKVQTCIYVQKHICIHTHTCTHRVIGSKAYARTSKITFVSRNIHAYTQTYIHAQGHMHVPQRLHLFLCLCLDSHLCRT
jgi:hypothetical protein